MFDNIGNKIKDLAIFICWIGIGVSVVIGMILLVMGSSAADSRYTEDAAPGFYIAGFAVAAVGSLLSWVGSFFMYGFGELIEDTQKIRESICPDISETPPAPRAQTYDEKVAKINAMRAAGQLSEEEYNRAINNLGK